jgi:hypothetical protein
VIWGKKDPFIPPSQAEKQRQAFPHARIKLLPDSGHWVHIDAARKVRALTMGFLRPRLRARRAGGFGAGSRLLRVRVRVTGVLPAYRVVARLRRHGELIATSGRRVTVRPGRRVLRVRVDAPLRATRYVLSVRARGLPVRVIRVSPR